MADESHVIRGINWRETFPFTQIFRAFRVAIHPTKLILALVALLGIYAGGRILDAIWPVSDRAVPGEIALYEGAGDGDFDTVRARKRRDLEDDYAGLLQQLKIEADDGKAHIDARKGARLSDVKRELIKTRDENITKARARADEAIKAAKGVDAKKIEEEYKQEIANGIGKINGIYSTAGKITGGGLFIEFFRYEVGQVNHVVSGVLANDWLGGFADNPYHRNRPGVLKAIGNFTVSGPWWLARYHTTYFVLFVVLFSILWAIFGGAICRIAAVHVARDEKISLSNALKFSTGKFLSFIFAPVIPLLIVLVVGLIVTIGGLLGNIPVIGPFLVGLFFFLALAAGFVMTLVLLGTGGGFNLMYPTIAVEGSDSFDAISRSFSYVYARPWRMIFYSLVAVLYGALCFLFVRYFIAIMLILTHHFVGAGMFKNVDGNAVPLDLWNTMWPTPGGQLTYDIDTLTLGPAQTLGAVLVAVWVYITVGMLGAFAISFYFSANSIIYFLMRREVDATELDDVYLEQSDEDFGDAPAAAAIPAAATPAPAGGETSPAVPPATT